VLIETLKALTELSGPDLPDGITAGLRDRLEADRKQALDSLKADDALLGAVQTDIEAARTRAAAWTFESDGFQALAPGLRRIYRRGRRAMHRAQADPTSENLHEWRKRVKDLWHAEQILRPAAPKRMKKLAERTHGLADLLGDDHDLAELVLYTARYPDCFDNAAARTALLAVIERRRSELQRRAFAVGAKLYDRSPKRFVKVIRRGWPKRTRPPTAAA
jgi:CHAD domain-containing protein